MSNTIQMGDTVYWRGHACKATVYDSGMVYLLPRKQTMTGCTFNGDKIVWRNNRWEVL